ncbi:MAG: efflux RND transporter permease subunit [Bacteroidota bacterium]
MIGYLIRRPIGVTSVTVALLLLGAVALRQLPISLMPEQDIPRISLKVAQEGLSTDAIENIYLEPLRSVLLQVPHVQNLESIAEDGVGRMELVLAYGAPTDYVYIAVNEEVDRVMAELPADYARPTVTKASSADIPIYYLDVRLKGPAEGEGEESVEEFLALSNLTRQVVRRRLEQLKEVAFVDISGTQKAEIIIEPRRGRMESMGLSMTQLETLLKNQELPTVNFAIRDGHYQFPLSFETEVPTVAALEALYFNVGGRVVQLRDLARVYRQPAQPLGMVKTQGESAISLTIIKQPAAQMAELNLHLTEVLEQLEAEYPRVGFTLSRNQNTLLDLALNNLWQSLLWGGIFAVLIVFAFLRDLRAAVLIAITLPIALILSVLCFYLLGISFNIISLSGLILGIGMMVDNGIIVVENIKFYQAQGSTIAEACVQGSEEVVSPMISSWLTTAAIFVPLIFLSGLVGALFYDQALSVVISTGCSLAVSAILIPVYDYVLYRNRKPESTTPVAKPPPLVKAYERVLAGALARPAIIALVSVGVVLAGIGAYRNLPTEQLPDLKEQETLLTVDWNEPITVEENWRRMHTLLSQLNQDSLFYTAYVGVQQFVLGEERNLSTTQGQVYLRTASSTQLTKTKEQLEPLLLGYPRVRYAFASVDNLFTSLFAEDTPYLQGRLRPHDGRVLAEPQRVMAMVDSLEDRAETDLTVPISTQTKVVLKLNLAKLALYGLNSSVLTTQLVQALAPFEVLSLTEEGTGIAVKLGLPAAQLDEVLATTFIQHRDTLAYPISAFVERAYQETFSALQADAGGAYFPVNLPTSVDAEPTMEQLAEHVSAIGGYELDFVGTFFSSQTLVQELLMIMLVALALLYLILAIQFESLTQPLIILTEVPISVAGCMVILWLTGYSLNLMSLVGLIITSGIIINDSILKVAAINQFVKEGIPLKEAVLLGGERRLRPIVMTSLTTMLAMAPVLLGGGLGAELQKPLAVTVIGGLGIGTLASLFLIPQLYGLLRGGRGWFRNRS